MSGAPRAYILTVGGGLHITPLILVHRWMGQSTKCQYYLLKKVNVTAVTVFISKVHCVINTRENCIFCLFKNFESPESFVLNTV
jgi:hypothetical protein